MQRRHHPPQHHHDPLQTLQISHQPLVRGRGQPNESSAHTLPCRRENLPLATVQAKQARKLQICITYTRSLNILVAISLLFLLRVFVRLLQDQPMFNYGAISPFRRDLRSNYIHLDKKTKLFPKIAFMTDHYQQSSVVFPRALDPIPHFLSPDYGGLQITSLPAIPFKRRIAVDEPQLASRYRRQVLRLAENIRASYSYTPYDDLDWPRKCVRPAWTYRMKPTCNIMHEMRLEANGTKYLGRGFYRDSWEVKENSNQTRFVVKHLRYKHNHDNFMEQRVMTEAIVMDALSPSPVVTNIYSHCATSLAVEVANELTHLIVPHVKSVQKEHGRISQAQYEKLSKDEPYSFNNLTIAQKLDFALQMAESLAESHGFKYSVIVNDDVHPDQWLITDDNRVVLNDMNNAVFLGWNDEKKRYCRFWISYGGDYRAPEEYEDDGSYVDESVDVYPMGNLIHSLLTGLWPYYDLIHQADIENKALSGEPPFLDPRFRTRSLVEKRMSDIMDQCHKFNPKDRVDIFEVVRYLHETKALHYANTFDTERNNSFLTTEK